MPRRHDIDPLIPISACPTCPCLFLQCPSFFVNSSPALRFK